MLISRTAIALVFGSVAVIINVLLAFSQFERDLILERTQTRKAIARTRVSFHKGRPPIPATRKVISNTPFWCDDLIRCAVGSGHQEPFRII